ncbi:CRAL/TRIO domain-containing protein [Suillus decipiens]|nr:CRAL/TRIO domain-containing protein [Suillus decipiens]
MNNRIARSVLEDNHKRLIDQYKTNLADVCALQSTLNDEILSHVVQEFALSDADHTWAKEWISDTATIFRFLRHHRFVRSFALEAIHTTLIWRLNALRFFAPCSALLHCLPPPICDPLGRPLVFLRLSELLTCKQTMLDGLLISLDHLRIHLRSLNTFNNEFANGEVTLQCILVIDLEGLAIQSVNLKILTWFMKEAVPRYPGMLGAVFFLNYSWTYATTWSIAKCLLPKSAVARVFFPSREELLQYCSVSTLPSNYGGAFSPLHHPLKLDGQKNCASVASHEWCMPAPSNGLPKSLHRQHSSVSIPPRSSLNPFFGYPTVASLSRPHMVQQGRRRKRDLLLTLSVLWWRRWGTRIIVLFYFLVTVGLTRKKVRRVLAWMLGALNSAFG